MDEFVAAGDALTRASPRWRWARGSGAGNSALPPAKQFLLCEGVTCRGRTRGNATAGAAAAAAALSDVAGEAGWVAADGAGGAAAATATAGVGVTGGGDGSGADTFDDVIVATAGGPVAIAAQASGGAGSASAGAGGDDDEYGDLSSYVDASLVIRDNTAAPVVAAAAPPAAPAAAPTFGAAAAAALRTYALSITYDFYYKTPRVFLQGVGAGGGALSPEDMLQDVVQDYVEKTATIEGHPALGGAAVSIHPCRHAATMKTLVAAAAATAAPGAAPVAVEAYLFIFLKFFSSVVPLLEYDHVSVKIG